MMTTTYSRPLNAPTGDDELDLLMHELREKTGKNWQVEKFNTYTEKRLFKPDIHHCAYQLLLEVGGVLPYQVIMCASGEIHKIKAYIYGHLSGLQEFEQYYSEQSDRIAELNDTVECLRSWFDATETLPEADGEYLCYRPKSGSHCKFKVCDFYSDDNNFGSVYPVTHWQHLPSAPR